MILCFLTPMFINILILLIFDRVLAAFKFVSRMPQNAQILVLIKKIFLGGMPPDPPRNFLFFWS